MAKIIEYREIPLDDLVISKGQVRTQNVGVELDELAESIEVQGLLQPILVCPARDDVKWEILTGQRRFLAHRLLQQQTGKAKYDSIAAAVLDQRVEQNEAKAISLTENLIRRKLLGVELKDAILFLYNQYGTIKDVAEKTGLPLKTIRDNIKYPRLLSELKKMVDDGDIDINAAIKAQDGSVDPTNGNPNLTIAIDLAREMASMSGVQRTNVAKNVTKRRAENPHMPLSDVIEMAKTGGKVIQVIATVTQDTHAAIQQFARQEHTNQDEAIVALIEESLVGRGLLEE